MKTKLEKILLIVSGLLMCICIGFVIFCFAPPIHNIYGTYSMENVPSPVVIVFTKDGTYTLYREYETLGEGTYEIGYSKKGVEVLCLSEAAGDRNTAVVYEFKEVFLSYKNEQFVLKKISDIPMYSRIE